jgi:hypothetical protein
MRKQARGGRARLEASMSVELISILVLVVIFLIATVRPINLGALAIVAAFIVGVSVLDGADLGEKTDAVFAGFPGDLFIILVWSRPA